mmetsp:Transcript_2853/g.5520  ORF Transcript_2853/g.5520 Transcript_2853/m.5520 type:complete len:295 (-) Transcript_2853:346-1230(-)
MPLQRPGKARQHGLRLGRSPQVPKALGHSSGLGRVEALLQELAHGEARPARRRVARQPRQHVLGGLRPARGREVLALRCRQQANTADLEAVVFPRRRHLPPVGISSRHFFSADCRHELSAVLQLQRVVVQVGGTSKEQHAKLRGAAHVDQVCIRVQQLPIEPSHGAEALGKGLLVDLGVLLGLGFNLPELLQVDADTVLLQICQALSKFSEVQLGHVPHVLASGMLRRTIGPSRTSPLHTSNFKAAHVPQLLGNVVVAQEVKDVLLVHRCVPFPLDELCLHAQEKLEGEHCIVR